MTTSTRHPSYGVIGAARWTCGGRGLRMFGSKLPGHNSGITITIREADSSFDLGHERISGVGGKVIAEVRLSSVQWAELLTTMNHGDGVPCTIRHALGDTKIRPEPPPVESEPERVRAEVTDRLHSRVIQIRDVRATLAAKLKGKVPAALAREVDGALEGVEQELVQNIPWYTEMFAAATDRIVVGAKAEVEAFIANTTPRLGAKAMEMGGIRALLSDGGGE